MAVLKKGSKGKEVSAAQKLLNKAGAKPPLKEDGDFGSLTDKQTRAFQKKAKLSADGKIGPKTLAALKFGGPLPVMPEMVLKDNVLAEAKYGAYASTLSKDVNKAISQYETAAAAAAKKFAETKKALELDVKDGKKRTEIAKKLVAQISLFEKTINSDPAKAKKAVPEIKKLYDQWESIYLGGSGINWRGRHFDDGIKGLESAVKALKAV